MLTKQIRVRDTNWKVVVLSRQDFEKDYGKKCVAITFTEKNTIYFNKANLTIKVVIHELFHAYCASLYIGSANLKNSQFEEIIAEFLEDYILVIYNQSIQLFKALKK